MLLGLDSCAYRIGRCRAGRLVVRRRIAIRRLGTPRWAKSRRQCGVDPRSLAHWLARSALVTGMDRVAVDDAMRTDRDHDADNRAATSASAGQPHDAVHRRMSRRNSPHRRHDGPTGWRGRPTRQAVATQPMRSIPVISDLDDYWETVATGVEPDGPRLHSSIRIGLTKEGTLAAPGRWSRQHQRRHGVFRPWNRLFRRESRKALGQRPEATRSRTPSHGADLEVRRHVVMARETLWSIAHDELGTATRWREIADLNYGLRQADGRSLDSRHWMAPGWQLLLPDDGIPVPLTMVRLLEGRRSVWCLWQETLTIQPARLTMGIHRDLRRHPPTVPLVPFGAGVVGEGVASAA